MDHAKNEKHIDNRVKEIDSNQNNQKDNDQKGQTN